MSFQRMLHLCGLLCLAGALTGCGGDSEGIVPAKGVVTFKGEPIGKIAVVFMPVNGTGLVAQGKSDAAGNFVLQTKEPGDGAKVGSYTVAFRYVPDEVADMPGFVGGKKPEPSPLPAKYGDASKSGITATVDSDASKNVYKFELK